MDAVLNSLRETKKCALILNNLLKVGKKYFKRIKKKEKYKNNNQNT